VQTNSAGQKYLQDAGVGGWYLSESKVQGDLTRDDESQCVSALFEG